MITERNHWFPGGKVGRYVLISPLATGGMAEVWIARQPGPHGFEKIVTIKRMIGAVRDDPEGVRMFLSEARLAAGLSHRFVVQIYELGEDEGCLYIVMEFIEGETLARVYRAALAAKEPVPVAAAVQLIAWAAEALHYAHTFTDAEGITRGLIHRDVSPHNLLLTADGSIKLVDFGIAKPTGDVTHTGRIKGKVTYMAPEQARAEPLDPRADVFALGVVLFELVTNTRLFVNLDDLGTLAWLRAGRPLPHCRERSPGVPAALDALVARAMATRRDDRFATARDFQTALEDWLAATGQRVGSGELAAYLNRLLPERAAERRALLEAARKGETLTPGLAPKLFKREPERATPVSAVPDEDLIPTRVATVRFRQPPPKRSPNVLVVGLAVAALAITGGALALTRPVRAPEPPVTPAAPLEPADAPGSLFIESTPEATVLFDDVPVGSTPLVVEEFTTGVHEVVLNAPGYLEHRGRVTVRSEGERLHLVLSLEKDLWKEPADAEDAGVVVMVPMAKPKRSVVRARGKLNLRTTPWTTIYLGKRRLGDTPLVGLQLPVGRHVLQVINVEAGIKTSIEIVIRPNLTTSESLVLR